MSSTDSETESIDQLYASPPEGETQSSIVEQTSLLQKRVKAVGSRQAVWDGDARKTSGNLTKADLFLCPKTGAVKSIKASQQSKDVMASRKASKAVQASKPEPVAARVKKIEQVLQEDEASPVPVVKHRRTKSVKASPISIEDEPAKKKPAAKKRASKKN